MTVVAAFTIDVQPVKGSETNSVSIGPAFAIWFTTTDSKLAHTWPGALQESTRSWRMSCQCRKSWDNGTSIQINIASRADYIEFAAGPGQPLLLKLHVFLFHTSQHLAAGLHAAVAARKTAKIVMKTCIHACHPCKLTWLSFHHLSGHPWCWLLALVCFRVIGQWTERWYHDSWWYLRQHEHEMIHVMRKVLQDIRHSVPPVML